jgi:hypothetical protein
MSSPRAKVATTTAAAAATTAVTISGVNLPPAVYGIETITTPTATTGGGGGATAAGTAMAAGTGVTTVTTGGGALAIGTGVATVTTRSNNISSVIPSSSFMSAASSASASSSVSISSCASSSSHNRSLRTVIFPQLLDEDTTAPSVPVPVAIPMATTALNENLNRSPWGPLSAEFLLDDQTETALRSRPRPRGSLWSKEISL